MNDNKITCDVCRDLLPLVKDGVASADSEAAVKQHLSNCSECEMLFDGKYIPAIDPSESPKALMRVKRWLSGIYAALMLLGLYFGFSLTAGSDIFYNCLIMPIVGVFGYLAFRWKALFAVPIILLVVGIFTNALGFFNFDGVEVLDLMSLILWVIIYSLFAVAGVIIAMLLHFAFGKVKKEGSDEYES